MSLATSEEAILSKTEQVPSVAVEARPRLLFFYAATDGNGRRAEGYLAQVLQRRRNHRSFVVHRIDVSERADLAERFRVPDSPTIVVIAEGKVQLRLVQPKGAAVIREQLRPWLR
jgi:thioredoxin-like negative regulator of GroEL